MRIFSGLSIFVVILTFSFQADSQVTINGPTCVIPGTVYQYTINGNWDSSSTMSLCVTGGVISDSLSSNACTATEPPIASALIDWDTIGPVTISITSSIGNVTLNITAIQPLTPGKIDSTSLFQNIGYDSIPTPIICSADNGGSCNPIYSDQWQQSTDQMIWTDIPGATGQNLVYADSLQQTTYFRRKVTEINSGSIAYSDVAMVSVIPPPTGFFFRKDDISVISSYALTIPQSKKNNLKTL